MAEPLSQSHSPLSSQQPFYSLVIPVFNEQDSLDILTREIIAVTSRLDHPAEIVFIDDESSDQSRAIMQRLSEEFSGTVRWLAMPGRCGQTAALRQGLKSSKGQILITLDADLQNDPQDIPDMLTKLNAGYDVVCGWRKARHDKPLKAVLSKMANLVQRRLTGLPVHDISCTLRVYKRTCIRRLELDWEGQHRFIPLILAFQGFRLDEVEAHHRSRRFGASKYTHKRVFKVVRDFLRIYRNRKKYRQVHKSNAGEMT